MDFLLIAVGLVVLIGGAELLIRGASAFALRYGISELVVGLTIVAFGTSMPEFVVSASASLSDHPDLAISNVLGSNIVNVLGILGIAALIRSLPVSNTTVIAEIPFSLTAALLVGFLANAALFTHSAALEISRIDGLILLFFFALFMAYVYVVAKNDGSATTVGEAGEQPRLPMAALFVALGLAGLFAGGALVVDSAVDVATRLGVSEAVIGLTIVAVGTSLPELFTSAVAAYRGNTDMAVGNVIGSNIFNLLWILGCSAVITELPFSVVSNFDLAMVVFATALVLVAIAAGRKACINRLHGALFVAVYVGYVVYIIQRG
ncbi:MAG: calcium/sodium antiporter [Pseudomonadales bacterium]